MVRRREHETIRNRILLALPHDLRELVVRHGNFVELELGRAIYASAGSVDYIYFVNDGLVSLLKRMEDGRSAEVAAVGAEGVIGLFAAYGFDRTLLDYIVQIPVSALRISSATLRNELARHEALRRALTRYSFQLADQLAQISACNRLHTLEQRFCYWLLVAHDNARSATFPFTHEFLASLLGVWRPSLSLTANRLQKRGLIRYSRGDMKIINRAALEQACCECYRVLRMHGDRLAGLRTTEDSNSASLRQRIPPK